MKNFKRLELGYVMNFQIPLDTERIFEHLIAQIHQENCKNTLTILGQASIRLYKSLTEKKKNLFEADLELIQTEGYLSEADRKKFQNLKAKNPQFILFSQQAFRLIYYILIHDVAFNIDPNKSIFSPMDSYTSFSLAGVFLIANEILSRIESISSTSPEESAAIRDFYSRCLIDPAGAIGRSALFYDNSYFNEQIKERFDLSVTDLRQMSFDLFAHVLSHDPAIIDPRSSFRVLQEKQPTIHNVLDLISAQYKSQKISISELISEFPINLAIGKKIRGKPFIEANGLYFCVCPELLGSVLSDFAHHVLFTDMIRKKEDTNALHDQRGQAYQTCIKTLSESVLGNICREETRKKHGEFGDLIIYLGPEEILMIELKIADPQDSVKKGNIAETIKRFLLPPERKTSGKKYPGPLQVMERAMEYRTEFGFKGKIHTAVMTWGWYPEVPIFDLVYKQNIKTHEICAKYESDKANFPTILLNSFTWELMLSAIKQLELQSVSLQETLLPMVEVLQACSEFPSRSSDVIEKYFESKNLKFSVSPLFREQIHALSEECKSMMKFPLEIVEKQI